MKYLKQLAILLPFIAFFMVMVPGRAAAVDVLSPVCGNTAGGTPTVCSDNESGATQSPLVGPSGILTRAVNLISMFVGIGAVFVITLAGLRMIITQGDPESFGRARQAILFAIFGLVLAATTQLIVRYVLYKL